MGPADDVYALGILLYQMLTGHSPYQTDSPDAQLHAARMRYIAPTPVLLVPGLPRSLAEVCRACMAKRPEERPTAAQVAIALWGLVLDPVEGAGTGFNPEPPQVPVPRLPRPEPEPVRPPGSHRRPSRHAVAGARPGPYSTSSG